MRKPALLSSFWLAISALTLLILLLYNYAYLFVVPDLGIDIYMPTGEVLAIHEGCASRGALQRGDVIREVDGVVWEDYIGQPARILPLFWEYRLGEEIHFEVRRGETLLPVDWIVPGPDSGEIWIRFLNLWWAAYLFMGFGVLTLQAVRPRDERWRLLMWFYHLAAIWIMVLIVSTNQVLYSMIVLSITTWLLAVLLMHLHWAFPMPLAPMNRWLTVGIYFGGIILAAAELLGWLPQYTHNIGLLLALLGSIVLLWVHNWRQPEVRWETRLLSAALVTVTLGSVAIGFLGYMAGSLNVIFSGLLFTPLIPVAYFYVISRRRLGAMEGSLNRISSWLVFASLLLALIIAVVTLVVTELPDGRARQTVSVGLVVLLGGIGMLLYPPFQRWFEGSFLGIRLPTEALMQSYSEQLVTRMKIAELVAVLGQQVLPDLQVNQAALLRLHGTDEDAAFHQVETLLLLNVAPTDLPTPEQARELLAQAGRYRPLPDEGLHVWPCPWVRLALPMKSEGQVVGLCLLGRRAPDNFYSHAEIPTLQALVDQTSLALANIEQAEMLLALSRREIESREAERRSLAHELHDEVLAQLAVLAQITAEPSPAFIQAYQDAVQRIRDVIGGLRPATLEQLGLHTALEELLDDLTERGERMDTPGPALELDLTSERLRYDREVELHLYRIVQQASYNVLEHAHAQKLVILGRLDEDEVDLEVIDDGRGFPDGNDPDLGMLLARQHFGLVTMHERASLIGAQVEIASVPGEGTRVRVAWRQGRPYRGL